ncbi:MAG TPA: DUF1153 domain-containing protein [Candidatus Paceibacterota bacterium]|nr:DUF1153 domain-containing protein [Candidatus Paceibacterota bacterium]
MAAKVPRSFRLDPDLAEKLEVLTQGRGQSFSRIMNLAVLRLLESEGIDTMLHGAVRKIVLTKKPVDLPQPTDQIPPRRRRWTRSRQIAFVHAVESGLFRLEDALSHYQITEEEYRSWENLVRFE